TCPVGENNFVSLACIDNGRDPRCGSSCVAGRVVTGQNHLAESYYVSTPEYAVDFYRRLAHHLPIFTVMKVTLPTLLHHRTSRFHDGNLRPPSFLSYRQRRQRDRNDRGR